MTKEYLFKYLKDGYKVEKKYAATTLWTIFSCINKMLQHYEKIAKLYLIIIDKKVSLKIKVSLLGVVALFSQICANKVRKWLYALFPENLTKYRVSHKYLDDFWKMGVASKWVKPHIQNFLCFWSIFIANFSENMVSIASIFPLSMALLCHISGGHK